MLATLLVLRGTVVFLCAAFGAVLLTAATFPVKSSLLGLPGGLLIGLLCGLLVVRRGLPYSGKRIGVVLGGCYLILVAISLLLVLVGPLGGLSGLMLTAPWSFVAGSLVDVVDPTLFDSVYSGPILIGACATVNAAILYGLGLLLSLLNKAVKLQ